MCVHCAWGHVWVTTADIYLCTRHSVTICNTLWHLPTFWSVHIGDDHKVCDVPLQIKFIARLLFQSLLLFVLFCLSHKGHYLSLSQVHLISEAGNHHHPPSCELTKPHRLHEAGVCACVHGDMCGWLCMCIDVRHMWHTHIHHTHHTHTCSLYPS